MLDGYIIDRIRREREQQRERERNRPTLHIERTPPWKDAPEPPDAPAQDRRDRGSVHIDFQL